MKHNNVHLYLSGCCWGAPSLVDEGRGPVSILGTQPQDWQERGGRGGRGGMGFTSGIVTSGFTYKK